MITKKQITNSPGQMPIFVSSLILVLGIVGLVWYIIIFQNSLVQTSALESAKLYSQALAEFRTIYTAKVVQKVNHHPDFEITHDYEDKKNAIPLPATLSMELGKEIGKHLSGAETWLYSEYPFPWRREAGGGLRDDFARKAWKSLNENPNKPYYEFVPNYKGRQVLRYATADLMRPSCINCHNTHPQTPRNNWKVDDVRGILEIVHPMEAVFAKNENGQLGLFFWAGGIGLFGVLSLLFLIRGYKKINEVLTTEVKIQIKDLQQAKKAVEAASRDTLQIMNSSPDFIFKSRIDNFKFTMVNETACRYYGYPQDEFLEMKIFDIEVKPRSKEQVRKLYDTTPVGKVLELYGTNKKKNGDTFPVHVKFIKLDEVFALANVRDITERKQAENKIKVSLKEKEVLLKEIHHRVKNNLQVMSSLLNLQRRHTTDEQVLKTLKEIQSRIQAMALVHEELYQSKDLASVDLNEYIRGLASYVCQTYGVEAAGTTLEIDVDTGVFFNMDIAIPCGLIINELVSNLLKHAFTEGTQGEIRIDLHANTDNQLTLTISDNGVGFPKDLDFKETKSLGLRLVNILTGQIGATIEIDRSDGTKFEIIFAVE